MLTGICLIKASCLFYVAAENDSEMKIKMIVFSASVSGVLGVFTPRNHARTSKNGSADVPRLPKIPEDVRWLK